MTLRLESLPVKTAAFVEPMECEPVSQLREGSGWVYEIKFDGYRAIAVKAGNQVNLFSRRRKSFNGQYPYVVEALADLPNDTVVDGELVALDDAGNRNLVSCKTTVPQRSAFAISCSTFSCTEAATLLACPLKSVGSYCTR